MHNITLVPNKGEALVANNVVYSNFKIKPNINSEPLFIADP